ncbi:MAG: DUF47 family protein [Nitrososphaerales archaeon]
MLGGEVEILYRRKALTLLQDEARKVLDAARELPSFFDISTEKNPDKLIEVVNSIKNKENDVQVLRRDLTKSLAEVGALVLNREDLLRVAYGIEDIAAYVSSTAFRISQLLKSSSTLMGEIKILLLSSIEGIQKLNEAVLALSMNPSKVLEIAENIQKLEREIDDEYKNLIAKILDLTKSIKEMILLKDIVEGIEDMMDECLHTSDTMTILALSL